MERAALVGGVILAIVMALSSLGHDSLHFTIDGEDIEFGGGRAAYVEPAAGRLAAATYAGDEVRVIHAAAVVVVTPEDRADISVEIDNPGRTPMPEVTASGGRVTIDGRLAGRIDNCSDTGTVSLDGYGEIARSDLPRITIRAPRELAMSLRGAAFGEIGPSQSAKLDFAGCGDSTVGDVTGRLEINAAGSGEVRAGAAGEVDADQAGSGTVTVGAVAGGINVDIAGSGAFTAASINGALEANLAGSGDVTINGGAVTEASVDIAGSGDVVIAAPVTRLETDILGSGGVDVRGVVGDVEASVAGSGDVMVDSVTGRLEQSSMGSGRVITRNRASAPTPAPAQAPPPR